MKLNFEVKHRFDFSGTLRTIYSRFSIRLCISLGGVPLQSSIFDCAAKKILNSIAFSISSKIRLSFVRL